MSDTRFPDVPGGYPFPRLELEVLEEWRRGRIFERTLEKESPRGEYVLYDGPPTANNVPHVGHVVTRVVKDLLPRYRTMRGYHVARKAGWDTHGLPVEIEVEKRLGFSGKKQIEAYGIAEFNAACLESVHTYERQWRAMTERVAYWTDMDHAYFTYTNEYVESVWWALAELARKDLLEKGYKIQPYCARCGTTLSSHEVAQNYKDADDPSVWVLFLARPGQSVDTADGGRWEVPEGLHLVAWTTTPWTLLAHVGLAVHPDMVYRVVEHPREAGTFLLFGDALDTPVPLLAPAADGGKPERLDLRALPAVARLAGSALEGLAYGRPFPTAMPPAEPGERSFDPPPSEEDGWRVVLGDYVTASEGTGLVHTAPPFGEDDYRTGKRYGLPFLLTVDADGKIGEHSGIEAFAGLGFKEADPRITRDLRKRGLLLHGDRTQHNYPFCWRCDQPLLYYATESWFVTTTRVRDRLVELNRTIGWHPPHVGERRFGNWLENVVDWALSRKRYWGTPLPVWECGGCEARRVIGSYEELFEASGREMPADPYDREQFDPHRPFIDAVTWECACGGAFTRVEEVIDAWFDSGSMPFAQHHYPFENREAFEAQFPANVIAEAVDQTRGWFYTLHALGTLLFDSVAYETCIVLGHVNDESGRKMSKRLGNVVEPMAVLEEAGADALRWYFCVNNPIVNARFSARLVREAAQGFLLPLWNALSFFTIYANLDGWRPGSKPQVPFAERPALDRWILLRLGRLVASTTEHLEAFSIHDAARGIESFTGDLTNWYIRRSRDRFWAPGGEGGEGSGGETEKESAYQSLYEVLTALSGLLAPFTPFVAEVLHRHLVRTQDAEAPESIHLADWPEPAPGREEPVLERAMDAVLRIVRLGHAARNSHGLKTRQPLAGVTLVTADASLPEILEDYTALLAEELNVKEVRWAADRGAYVHHEVKPFFPKCGPRFGKRMKEVQAALAAADGDRLAEQLESEGAVTVDLADGPERLSAEEVEVRLVEREGTATQGDRELLVALETALDDELIAEGWAREVVHRIQNARKQADLDYADRIRVRFTADPELAQAIEGHREWIAGETLAVEVGAVESGKGLESAPVEGLTFSLGIEKV